MATRKPLTHARQAEVDKPEAKPYKLNVGEGLFLEVIPSGAKRWRLRYGYAAQAVSILQTLKPVNGQHERVFRSYGKSGHLRYAIRTEARITV